jgi:predicted DNA-binding transcriptional regulator AlpA
MRLLSLAQVQQRGIPYCRDHLRRLVRAGKFPRPVEVGPGRIAWVEEEVDAYIEQVVAKRDEQAAPPVPETIQANASIAPSGAPRKNTTRRIERPQAMTPRQQYLASSRRSSRRSS